MVDDKQIDAFMRTKPIYQTIDECRKWVEEATPKPSHRRKFQLEYEHEYFGDGSQPTLKMYVYDSRIAHGMYLPDNFSGSITDYICAGKQIDTQSTIDTMEEKLKVMKEDGCENL